MLEQAPALGLLTLQIAYALSRIWQGQTSDMPKQLQNRNFEVVSPYKNRLENPLLQKITFPQNPLYIAFGRQSS